MSRHPLTTVWALCRELDRRHDLLYCSQSRPNPIPDPKEGR